MAEKARVSGELRRKEAIIGEKSCSSGKYNVRLDVFGSFGNPLLDSLSKNSGGMLRHEYCEDVGVIARTAILY